MLDALDLLALWFGRIAILASLCGLLWLLLVICAGLSLQAADRCGAGARAYWRGLRRHPGVPIGLAWPAMVAVALAVGGRPLGWPTALAWAAFSLVPWALILLTVNPEGER